MTQAPTWDAPTGDPLSSRPRSSSRPLWPRVVLIVALAAFVVVTAGGAFLTLQAKSTSEGLSTRSHKATSAAAAERAVYEGLQGDVATAQTKYSAAQTEYKYDYGRYLVDETYNPENYTADQGFLSLSKGQVQDAENAVTFAKGNLLSEQPTLGHLEQKAADLHSEAISAKATYKSTFSTSIAAAIGAAVFLIVALVVFLLFHAPAERRP